MPATLDVEAKTDFDFTSNCDIWLIKAFGQRGAHQGSDKPVVTDILLLS